MPYDIRRSSSSLECIHREQANSTPADSDAERGLGDKHSSNEKLFVHCLNLFFTYLRPWVINQRDQLQPHFDVYLDLCMKVFCIPNDKHLQEYIQVAVSKSLRYRYTLQVAVVDTKGLKLQEGGNYCLTLWSCGNCRYFAKQRYNIVLCWSPKSQRWIAKRTLKAKKLTVANLQVDTHVLDKDEPICFTFKQCRSRGFFSSSSFEGDVVGEFWFKPSQLNPEGFHSWVQFNREVSLLIRMRWSIRRPFIRGGPIHFTRSRLKHSELIDKFIEFRKANNETPKPSGQCRKEQSNAQTAINNETLGLIQSVSDIFRDSSGDVLVGRPNDLQVHVNMLLKDDSLADEYCICDEWCNIDAFYYYNPVVRWIIVQNHYLSRLEETCAAVYHFCELSKLIVGKNLDCTSLLESCTFYLDNEITRELGKLKYMYIFHETKIAMKIFRAYHILREEMCCGVFANPNESKLTKFMGSFQAYCRIVQWLKIRLHFSDLEMDARLRQRCYTSGFAWLNAIVNNPDMDFVCKTRLFDPYINYTTKSSNKELYKKFTIELSTSGVKPPTILNCGDNLTKAIKAIKGRQCANVPKSVEKHSTSQVLKRETKPETSKVANKDEKSGGPTFILPKGVSFLHRFHEIMRTLDDLDTERIDHFDLRRHEYTWMKMFNEAYVNLSQNSPADFIVTIENKQKGEKWSIVERCYSLKLYYVAFDLQTLLLSAIKSNFGENTAYLVPYEELGKFFSNNSWIENAFDSSNKEFIFPLISAYFQEIHVLVNSFCQSKHKDVSIRDPLSCVSLQKVFIRDYEQVLSNPAIDSSHNLTSLLVKIFKQQIKAYNDFYQLIRSKQFVIPNIKLEREHIHILTGWLVRGLGYNIISCLLVMVHNTCKAFDQVEHSHVFPKTVEAWKDIIGIHRVISELLQSCTGWTIGETDYINRNIRNIGKETKSICRLLFTRICVSWLIDMRDIIKAKDRAVESTKNRVFKIHLAIGCSLILASETEFKTHAASYKTDLFTLLLAIQDVAKGQSYIVFVDNFFKQQKHGQIFTLEHVKRFIEGPM